MRMDCILYAPNVHLKYDKKFTEIAQEKISTIARVYT